MIKYFSFLLALMLPICGFAYDFMVGGIAYNFNPDGNSVTVTFERDTLPSYSNASTSLTIPNSVSFNGKCYSVTAIGNRAFSGCNSFKGSLTIPNSVSSIGDNAFYDN